MSVLLDRMILRLQAPLSPVQPLLPSRYAPPAGGPLDSDPASHPWDSSGAGESLGAPQVVAYIAAIPARGGGDAFDVPVVGGEPIVGTERERLVGRAPRLAATPMPDEQAISPAGIPERVPAAGGEPIEAMGHGRLIDRAPRPAATPMPDEQATSPAKPPGQVPTGAVRTPTSARNLGFPKEPSAERPKPPLPANRTEDRHASEGARAEPVDRAGRRVQVRTAREPRSERALDRGPIGPNPRHVPREAGPQSFKRDREGEPGPQAPGRPRSQHDGRRGPTEVSISIGHIEVRSVRRNDPPRRLATRPRVTLDEFLRRRNGTSR